MAKARANGLICYNFFVLDQYSSADLEIYAKVKHWKDASTNMTEEFYLPIMGSDYIVGTLKPAVEKYPFVWSTRELPPKVIEYYGWTITAQSRSAVHTSANAFNAFNARSCQRQSFEQEELLWMQFDNDDAWMLVHVEPVVYFWKFSRFFTSIKLVEMTQTCPAISMG